MVFAGSEGSHDRHQGSVASGDDSVRAGLAVPGGGDDGGGGGSVVQLVGELGDLQGRLPVGGLGDAGGGGVLQQRAVQPDFLGAEAVGVRRGVRAGAGGGRARRREHRDLESGEAHEVEFGICDEFLLIRF